MGISCGHTKEVERKATRMKSVARTPEATCGGLALTKSCQSLPVLPSCEESTVRGSPASVGVASQAVAASPPGLRRTISRLNVSDSSGCVFEVRFV